MTTKVAGVTVAAVDCDEYARGKALHECVAGVKGRGPPGVMSAFKLLLKHLRDPQRRGLLPNVHVFVNLECIRKNSVERSKEVQNKDMTHPL